MTTNINEAMKELVNKEFFYFKKVSCECKRYQMSFSMMGKA
jgi:hypothetical protein